MPRLPRPAVRALARWVVRPVTELPLPWARRGLDAVAAVAGAPGGVAVLAWRGAGLRGERLAPAGEAGPARILYLHGGGYRIGSPRSHRAPAGALAGAAGVPVVTLDYRLAPEHPAPAALEDALAAYRVLAGAAGAPLVIAGDSAGGGLALATAVALRDAGEPQPAGLALISPWVDLTLAGASVTANASRDALLGRRLLERGVRDYAAPLGAEDPRCSPLGAELGGLAPILIHAAADELLLSEAEALAARARAAGVEAELEVAPGLWHDYHGFAGTLREADEALGRLGRWAAARLADT